MVFFHFKGRIPLFPFLMIDTIFSSNNTDTIVTDTVIKWVPYVNGENLLDKFPKPEWKKIASDIYSNEDFEDLISAYPQTIRCWVLQQNINNSPCALVILIRNRKENCIYFHGGGWKKSVFNAYLYYRGVVLLIEYLLNKKIKVKTSCFEDNDVAFRFIRSLGFVNYKNISGKHLFWINKERFYTSDIYNFITTR